MIQGQKKLRNDQKQPRTQPKFNFVAFKWQFHPCLRVITVNMTKKYSKRRNSTAGGHNASCRIKRYLCCVDVIMPSRGRAQVCGVSVSMMATPTWWEGEGSGKTAALCRWGVDIYHTCPNRTELMAGKRQPRKICGSNI